MGPDPQIIERLVQRIVEIAHPLRIILFGSAARGEMKPDSDIDVLVVMPEGTNRGQVAGQLYRDVHGLGAPFDFLVTTPAELERYGEDIGFVYHRIIREGRDVYAA